MGYVPIVQAPAHEMDTLPTVVERCRHVAYSLGLKHVVLTVDEALYCKLMECEMGQERILKLYDCEAWGSAYCNEFYEGDRETHSVVWVAGGMGRE